jgi:hypothetical protein
VAHASGRLVSLRCGLVEILKVFKAEANCTGCAAGRKVEDFAVDDRAGGTAMMERHAQKDGGRRLLERLLIRGRERLYRYVLYIVVIQSNALI